MDTSLADIAAVTRNDEGWGGNGLWLFAILALMNGGFGGWGNNRYGAGDYGTFATAASQQEILFGQHFQGLTNQINQTGQALDNKIDRIGNGIADLGYANQSLINNAQTVLGGAINAEGRAVQMQVAEGFCETQKAIHAEGEATRALIQQNKIEDLRDRISQLEMNNAMCGVVRYPMASAYYAPNPFCNCGGNGCGCGA